MVIKAPKLKDKANIRIIAPASPPDMKVLSAGINILKKAGYTVSLGNNLRRLVQKADLAAPDKDRAEELNTAFKDPSVDAIFCARGGYGSTRIVPLVDYDAIKDHPKIFMGYSDITSLHLAIHKFTNLITFHGPMPGADLDEMKKPSFASFIKVLRGESNDIFSNVEKIIKYVVPGTAEGISEGTNISTFASLIGTDYMPDLKGKIAFFEDIATTSSDVDRYLFRLKLGKMLDKFNGFVFGDFTDIPKSEEPLPAIEEIIQDYMLDLKKPSLYGLPFGHGDDQMLIPLNAKVKISSEEPSLQLLEEVVN
ncbi:LD-carboxypeptidase [Candidatus Parvarchaeota archaeon]|uniref:LD-carboxypeptidase n=1 Tax=Candidatus Acidifodinimicrobium mancum TaxID=2898728 RepID=A0A8T3V075_9ARCH|nr:LD-carboxypeptidase [Candidatus Acidifodinimicrobium mancum]